MHLIDLFLFILLVVLATQVHRLQRRVRDLEDAQRRRPVPSPRPVADTAPVTAPTPAAGVAAPPLPPPPPPSSPPSPSSPRTPALPDWRLAALLKQNLFAAAGVGLLLLGFAFLLRSIHWGELLPPWARLGLAWAFAGALGVLGVKLRARHAAWSQIAQGGATAIAYLATYVAATRYGILAGPAAFAVFALLAAVLVWRALAEDSKVLAAVGFLGAYAAPLLALERADGALSFNLGYGLLLTACALAVSQRKRWLEIAVHAHVCAAGLAALTWQGDLPPLAPWVQQAFLHA
jgi:uncharacterized membrane protein